MLEKARRNNKDVSGIEDLLEFCAPGSFCLVIADSILAKKVVIVVNL